MFEDDPVTVAEHFGYSIPRPGAESNLLITNDNIGVEVEIEDARDIERPSNRWTTHADGSLRNHGMEFVFNGPQSGASAIQAINSLESRIARFQTGRNRPISLSARTSVHVHVDVSDLSANELAAMTMVYAIFETPLFKAFAPSRFNNHFCTRYTQCLDFISLPRMLAQGFSNFSNTFNVPGIGRYCALNVKSVFKHGTVEFRHHPGEWRAAPLILWINACLSFKRAARSNINFRQMFFENCSNGFHEQLRTIFPKDVADKILATYGSDTLQFHRDVVNGIRFVQNSINPIINLP